MAIRVCPHCQNPIPASLVTAHTDNLECPHCQTLLEVSYPSRMPAMWIAMGAAWLVWYLTRRLGGTSPETIDWVLPEVYAILTFGIVGPLVLMFTGAPILAPVLPESNVSVGSGAAGHGAGHGSSHGSGPAHATGQAGHGGGHGDHH